MISFFCRWINPDKIPYCLTKFEQDKLKVPYETVYSNYITCLTTRPWEHLEEPNEFHQKLSYYFRIILYKLLYLSMALLIAYHA